MPCIIINGPAPTIEAKRRTAEGVTKVVSECYGIPEGHILVFMQEYDDSNVSRGGELISDIKAKG